MTCNACGGPRHDSTCQWLSQDTVLCGPCARSFVAFVRGQLRRREHREGHVQRPSPDVRTLD